LVGEFRVALCGFFRSRFRLCPADGGQGSGRAVLEVRWREVPFHPRRTARRRRLVYEKMLARPNAKYRPAHGFNYQAQGLKLSKHFRVVSRHCCKSGHRFTRMVAHVARKRGQRPFAKLKQVRRYVSFQEKACKIGLFVFQDLR